MTWYDPRTWLPNSDDEERPPEPDSYHDTTEKERPRYEATIEYRNGDVETFDCYGIYRRNDAGVTFNTDPYASRGYSGGVTHSFDRRSENYEVLAREPELEEVATDRFVISYRVEWEWETPGVALPSTDKEWCKTHYNVTLDVERDIDDD